MTKLNTLFLFLLLSQNGFTQSVSTDENVLAQDLSDESISTEDISESDTIYVIGSKEKAFYTPGSATFIDKKELEVFNYKDVSRILDKVPGVYIQEEDGLGLRPNIGLRGAHPHRSKKITLMEDGILVGPAPYAAPAAYYFPSTSRIGAMEVYKGPSSVMYGPNSVGGAINMVTPGFNPSQTSIELSGGTFQQLQANHSQVRGAHSVLAQATHKQGKLLRQTPGVDDYEFNQNDFLLKYGINLSKLGAGYSQKLLFKASFADELSDETYLGLSDSDFNSTPYNRYAASQEDQMKWQRWGLLAKHEIKPTSSTKLSTNFYHHSFQRTWRKFNDLANYQDFRGALNGGADADNLIALLRGERDSADETEYLRIGANARSYFSQGIQSQLSLSLDTGSLSHDLDFGLRLHRDQVRRNHTEQMAAMVGGQLTYDNQGYTTTNRNQDTSTAMTAFVQDEMIYNNLTMKIGARLENVRHERDPRLFGQTVQENDESVFVPGIGFNYSLNQNTALLAGVNKGVTLVGPGQDQSIQPEEAINYELGFRLKAPFYFESIAFYSDYQNLKGTCSFSTGCSESDLDTEFNGGQAEVYGLETSASHQFLSGQWRFPIKLNYTYTVARFKSELLNSNPEWGPTTGENRLIRVNDPMPYIPQSQLNFGTGVGYREFSADFNILWKSQVADQAVANNRAMVPSYGVIDTAFAYQYDRQTKAFFKVNNILDNAYLVSYRPFGARVGSPRTFTFGFNRRF